MDFQINVLYVSHYSHLRMGGQRSMVALIENLDREKFNPSAIVPEPGELSGELERLNCMTYFIPLVELKPKNLFRIIKSVRRIRKIIKKEKIDIVHPDHDRDAFVCGIAKAGTNAKMVWHVRLTSSKSTDWINQRLADGIIGITDGCRHRFSEETLESKFTKIYNGVDCSTFRPVDDKRFVRKKLGLPEDKFIVSFIGQIKEGKGIYDLVKGIKILSPDVSDNNMPLFLFIGAWHNPETEITMNKLIERTGTRCFIRIIPQQRNIHEWMQAADVIALPSHEGVEGMPRVVYEAMACGTCVIGSDISGTNEAIAPGTGLLVKEKSPEDIAENIKLLINNKELVNTLQENGRNRAIEFFDSKTHAKSVEMFYYKIL